MTYEMHWRHEDHETLVTGPSRGHGRPRIRIGTSPLTYSQDIGIDTKFDPKHLDTKGRVVVFIKDNNFSVS
jgi:hypothetical protein